MMLAVLAVVRERPMVSKQKYTVSETKPRRAKRLRSALVSRS